MAENATTDPEISTTSPAAPTTSTAMPFELPPLAELPFILLKSELRLKPDDPLRALLGKLFNLVTEVQVALSIQHKSGMLEPAQDALIAHRALNK